MEYLRRQIDSAEINPWVFKGTTLRVEPEGHPEDAFVVTVGIPRMPVGEGRGEVTILDKFPGTIGSAYSKGRRAFVIPYDVFINGGVFGGLKYPGILEEGALRGELSS